jgi:alpha-L-rhamnosidase
VREQRYDALIDTIRNYWGQQIDAGATTFWEMFHPGEARLTRSHCHGWSAAPTVFLSQHVLGIQPLTPGYDEILIAPKPGNLTWAHGRVPTPHGPVECHWSLAGDTCTLRIDAASDRPVRVELPFPGEVVVESGEASLTSPQVMQCRGPHIVLKVTRSADSRA